MAESNNDSNIQVTTDTVPRLSFSVEALREAGARLGHIESSLTPPKTTFEELIGRAHRLRDHVAARERGAG